MTRSIAAHTFKMKLKKPYKRISAFRCRGSASTCFYSAMFRNLIAYSDFLTMAAIALTRSVGLIGGLRSPRFTLRRWQICPSKQFVHSRLNP